MKHKSKCNVNAEILLYFITDVDNTDKHLKNGYTSLDSHIHVVDTQIKLEPEVQIRCYNDKSFLPSCHDNHSMSRIEIEDDDEDLRCPKCRITYTNKMSIKNHIQVCKVIPKLTIDAKYDKKDYASIDSINDEHNSSSKVRKLNEDEKKSLKILEQSCFNNMDKIAYDDVESDVEEYDNDLNTSEASYKCEECDEGYENAIKFARHCYAHTFIKIGKFYIEILNIIKKSF